MMNGDPNEQYDKVILSTESMMMNMNQIDTLRSVMMIAGGILAGVAECVGLQGFICFILLYICTTISVGAMLKFDFLTYLNMSFLEFAVMDASKHIMSFVLFWTLAYALIYIY